MNDKVKIYEKSMEIGGIILVMIGLLIPIVVEELTFYAMTFSSLMIATGALFYIASSLD